MCSLALVLDQITRVYSREVRYTEIVNTHLSNPYIMYTYVPSTTSHLQHHHSQKHGCDDEGPRR